MITWKIVPPLLYKILLNLLKFIYLSHALVDVATLAQTTFTQYVSYCMLLENSAILLSDTFVS